MFIGFNQDRKEFLKIKKQEEWDEDYYKNTHLTNVDRTTRYFLTTIYIIAFISVGCYSVQNSLPVLSKYYRRL